MAEGLDHAAPPVGNAAMWEDLFSPEERRRIVAALEQAAGFWQLQAARHDASGSRLGTGLLEEAHAFWRVVGDINGNNAVPSAAAPGPAALPHRLAALAAREREYADLVAAGGTPEADPSSPTP